MRTCLSRLSLAPAGCCFLPTLSWRGTSIKRLRNCLAHGDGEEPLRIIYSLRIFHFDYKSVLACRSVLRDRDHYLCGLFFTRFQREGRKMPVPVDLCLCFVIAGYGDGECGLCGQVVLDGDAG